MRANTESRTGRALARISWLSLSTAILAGCGGSSDVQEIPDAARKSLVARKVDVRNRTAKSPGSGHPSSRGRPPVK
jgi:hypothetical protein